MIIDTSDWTEHVSAKDPGTYSSKALLRKVVIDACLSITISVHPPPYARLEEPLHELGPTDSERILKILVRSSPVAVDGYCKALDAEFRHNNSSRVIRDSRSPWTTSG